MRVYDLVEHVEEGYRSLFDSTEQILLVAFAPQRLREARQELSRQQRVALFKTVCVAPEPYGPVERANFGPTPGAA
jgi:hypothetical protein